MSLSSGTRSLLLEIASWFGAACLLAFGLANYDELRSLTNSTLGIPAPGQVAAARPEVREEPQAQVYNSGTVELRANRNGHYITEADINGWSVNVLVDTGATMVALTHEDAERAGIYLNHSDYTHRVSTANGVARVAPVMLSSVSIGDITVRNVRAAVSEPGNLRTTLLGMTFLSRLERVDMRSGTLILED
ncbi:MAG: TIGR02281 family clan AA aspartic protease [Alphaproteobacteria bacterium]|nr:TIGR02281 family clan AA aspartic protease [Alphaproteobacteria bacterium]